jgi:hypothetical protein
MIVPQLYPLAVFRPRYSVFVRQNHQSEPLASDCPGSTFAKSATFNQDLCVKRFYPHHLVSQQLDWQLDPIKAFIVTGKLG